MAAYALVEVEVSNMDGMRPYIDAVAGTVAAFDGKYLVRAGVPEVVEGGPGQYPLKVILEFPSMDLAKRWYRSPEYQAILPYRHKNSKSNFIWLDGA
jgi:uncharacterized protein (DUF1330 family)